MAGFVGITPLIVGADGADTTQNTVQAAINKLAQDTAAAINGVTGGRGFAQIIAQSAVPASVTGTTAETTLATVVVPANVIGPNGQLRIRSLRGWVGGNGTRTPRIRISGTAVQDFGALGATQFSLVSDWFMYNTGAQNSQIRINTQRPNTSEVPTVQPGAFDTTQPLTVTFTEQLGSALDTGTLYAFTMEILNP